MAATHHSLLNDAVFFLFSFFFSSRFFSVGERGRTEFGPHPIKQGHTEFTTSRWDRPPPPGKCLRACVTA